MSGKGIDLKKLKKIGGQYVYRGRKWTVNKPVTSTSKGKKKMVLATKKIDGHIRGKIVHFGALGYGHNYSDEAKKNYLKRSAGIRKKDGTLTKNDPWSANYWARKILWPARAKATGPKKTRKAA